MAGFGKSKKEDLLSVAEELGLDVDNKMTMVQLKTLIERSEGYDPEFVREMLHEKRRERELELEREKQEKRWEQEQQLKRWEQEQQEKRLEREFQLEKLRLETASRASSVSTLAEPQRGRFQPQLHQLIPKFDPEGGDISLFLVTFERQARKAQVEREHWVTFLMSLLPMEIVQMIAREPEEKTDDYDYVRELLLKRFRLSAEKFRQKFVITQKKTQSTWKEFSFELRNYLDGWLEGLGIEDFEALKDLMVADQLKRRVSNEAKEHFIDEWGKIKTAGKLTEMLDDYENIRSDKKRIVDKRFPPKGSERPSESPGKSEEIEKQQKNPPQPERNGHSRDDQFERRRVNRCFNCGSDKHFKSHCPDLIKRDEIVTVNSIRGGLSDEIWLAPYTETAKVNGFTMGVLRDTGATIDIICQKYVNESSFTGKFVLVRQPLDSEAKRLPVAKVKINGSFGKIEAEAAVISNEFDRYLLGNRTASRLNQRNSEFLRESSNAGGTRSSKNKEFLRKEDSNRPFRKQFKKNKEFRTCDIAKNGNWRNKPENSVPLRLPKRGMPSIKNRDYEDPKVFIPRYRIGNLNRISVCEI